MLWKIFIGALAIRWTYALSLFALHGATGLQGVDSIGYLSEAGAFAQAIAQGSLHGVDWLGPSVIVMPLFAWMIGLTALVFGKFAALAYVLMQSVFDSATCLLVYGIGRTIDPKLALPAAVLAVINPTQIVLSGLVYNDTLFLFFVALFLFSALRWMRQPAWRFAVLLGLGLGASSLIRVVSVPFAPVLILFLVIVAVIEGRLNRRSLAQLASAGLIAALCIAPVLWRNVSSFGAWSLTSQGGQHLALWVVPLVKEAKDGTPWHQTFDVMQKRKAERFPEATKNPFEDSAHLKQIASEAMSELGVTAIVKAWIIGAAINLATPAAILSPPVSQLPRTGFYATHGASPAEKIFNFLFRSESATYAWILLVTLAGVVAMRALQLVGFCGLSRDRSNIPIACLFALWTVYILAINGPVASPKYRLPLEPIFATLAAAGLGALRGIGRRRKETNA